MEKYFELTDESIEIDEYTLYRIRCTKDNVIHKLSMGQFGGFVEEESNLKSGWIYGNAKVYGNAIITGNAKVYDNAIITGNAKVYGGEISCGSIHAYGYIGSENDFCTFSGFGRLRKTTTAYRSKEGIIFISRGCFSGTLNAFEREVLKVLGDSMFGREYLKMIELIKIRFEGLKYE
jgi:hypothetical protein